MMMEMTDRVGRRGPQNDGDGGGSGGDRGDDERSEAEGETDESVVPCHRHDPCGLDETVGSDRRGRNVHAPPCDGRFDAANPSSWQDEIPVPPAVVDDDEDDAIHAQDNKVSRRSRMRKRQLVLAEMAGMAGNVLEWYDFAVFGYLSDVIGQVFFPAAATSDMGTGSDDNSHPRRFLAEEHANGTGTSAYSENNDDPATADARTNTLYAFAVFGGAFLMRPIGGLLLGYWGDTRGTKEALVTSIFLMAFPTFALGCLPTFQQVGYVATLLLILVRMVQGLSVGGQLVTSIVFTLEGHPREDWGYRGSCVMATANVGSLLGSLVGYGLRASLSDRQLASWGWRLPFLSGIVVSGAGFYLRSIDDSGDGVHTSYDQVPSSATVGSDDDYLRQQHDGPTSAAADAGPLDCELPPANPVWLSVRPSNLRPLLAASMVPMLWSGSFYLTFVWMAVYMSSLSDAPVPYAFGINTVCMFLSLCLFFPLAGIASDRLGRRAVMTAGGAGCAVLGPVAIRSVSSGGAWQALAGQLSLGIAVAGYGAPMCAWLVEAFPDPHARLTSANVGYNVAQALAGGSAPALATLAADRWGSSAPGYLYSALAAVALTGLWLVAADPARSLSSSPTSNPTTELRGAPSSQQRRLPSRHGSVRGDFTSIPRTDDGLSLDGRTSSPQSLTKEIT